MKTYIAISKIFFLNRVTKLRARCINTSHKKKPLCDEIISMGGEIKGAQV